MEDFFIEVAAEETQKIFYILTCVSPWECWWCEFMIIGGQCQCALSLYNLYCLPVRVNRWDCFIEDAIMKLKLKRGKPLLNRISCRSSSSHTPALGSHQLCRSRYSEEQHENPFTSRTEIFRGPTWKSIHRLNSEKNRKCEIHRDWLCCAFDAVIKLT